MNLIFILNHHCIVDYHLRLQKHSEYLESMLQCHVSGLFKELLTRRVLSAAQVEDIKSEDIKMNRKLIKIMIGKTDYNQYEEFLVSLWTTHQDDLARCIIHDGLGE